MCTETGRVTQSSPTAIAQREGVTAALAPSRSRHFAVAAAASVWLEYLKATLILPRNHHRSTRTSGHITTCYFPGLASSTNIYPPCRPFQVAHICFQRHPRGPFLQPVLPVNPGTVDVAGFLELRVSFLPGVCAPLTCDLYTHPTLFAELWASAGL